MENFFINERTTNNRPTTRKSNPPFAVIRHLRCENIKSRKQTVCLVYKVTKKVLCIHGTRFPVYSTLSGLCVIIVGPSGKVETYTTRKAKQVMNLYGVAFAIVEAQASSLWTEWESTFY